MITGILQENLIEKTKCPFDDNVCMKSCGNFLQSLFHTFSLIISFLELADTHMVGLEQMWSDGLEKLKKFSEIISINCSTNVGHNVNNIFFKYLKVKLDNISI